MLLFRYLRQKFSYIPQDSKRGISNFNFQAPNVPQLTHRGVLQLSRLSVNSQVRVLKSNPKARVTLRFQGKGFLRISKFTSTFLQMLDIIIYFSNWDIFSRVCFGGKTSVNEECAGSGLDEKACYKRSCGNDVKKYEPTPHTGTRSAWNESGMDMERGCPVSRIFVPERVFQQLPNFFNFKNFFSRHKREPAFVTFLCKRV